MYQYSQLRSTTSILVVCRIHPCGIGPVKFRWPWSLDRPYDQPEWAKSSPPDKTVMSSGHIYATVGHHNSEVSSLQKANVSVSGASETKKYCSHVECLCKMKDR